MMNRNALIVGGGIGGMSAAIRLRELGWVVDLIEIDPRWRVYGAGISITAPTYRALKRLGVAREVEARGFASRKGVRICTPAGQLIVEQYQDSIEPDLPTHGGIMRPLLHQILSYRTRAAGTRVRLGVTLQSLRQTPGKAHVETSDGDQRDYDLVVAADGVFSQVRELLFPQAPRPTYTCQYCW